MSLFGGRLRRHACTSCTSPNEVRACSEDVKQFSELLKEHQKATLADGFSVLESAVIQHNLRSVSNMYRNIAVDQLALLLGLSEEKVESLACDMIFQGRLKGHIDQVRVLA